MKSHYLVPVLRAGLLFLLILLMHTIPPVSALPEDALFFINEVDADQAGADDNAEFVELYNGGADTTSMAGYTLVFYDGETDRSYFAIDLSSWDASPFGYFTLCGDAGKVIPCSVQINPGTLNLIQNGPDAIALYKDGPGFPNGTPVTNANLVDALVYGTDDEADPELLAVLTPGQEQVNENAQGLKDQHSNQRCPDGSGNAFDSSVYAQYPPTPGNPNTCRYAFGPYAHNQFYPLYRR